MDKDRVEGKGKDLGGKAKETWGDVTGDEETEAEGEADQAEGTVQEKWGEGKDAARDAFDDDDRA